jgi:hypothetical protein
LTKNLKATYACIEEMMYEENGGKIVFLLSLLSPQKANLPFSS